jgi:chromosome segregation ATPase
MEEQDLKQRISDELETFVNLAKENWVNSFQKELREAHWYLGEERTRKQNLENELQSKIQYIQTIENEIASIKKQLEEARWYLGEERTRREQLENALKGCQQHRQELETYLNQTRAWGEQLQKELSDTQWYLGEERSKRQHLESQINT